MIRGVLLAALLGLAAAPALAQYAVVIYRCTDASGAVSVQNDVPCPKGSQQQRRVIETAAPASIAAMPVAPSATPARTSTEPALPALVAMPVPAGSGSEGVSPVAGTAAAAAGATGDSGAPDAAGDGGAAQLVDATPAEPPPPLFSCRTWDRQEYFSDDPVPTRRCAPLRVSGLDGSAGGGQASACEYVTDTCAPVPDAALCSQWHRHAHDTRARLLFGRAEDPAATRIELERIEALIHASTCRGAG
ncbi:hypothetical protein INQ40_01025 [Lysobacter sp. H21R4]|uniref:hypothetical protein n=1 Tax=Lysobacter sp. H21R4 TaxID=2781021 RepID=UPI0018889C70|nr:hypothetical protein [Lysobacter sp. H21R4]QOY62923.1 hypothetical protein INQ40_01025 [Lysobacter sp. H21R4]